MLASRGPLSINKERCARNRVSTKTSVRSMKSATRRQLKVARRNRSPISRAIASHDATAATGRPTESWVRLAPCSSPSRGPRAPGSLPPPCPVPEFHPTSRPSQQKTVETRARALPRRPAPQNAILTTRRRV
jgi:hypothetical protein